VSRDAGNTTIYFDYAATSWPKPPGVTGAMVLFLNEMRANRTALGIAWR
jgi:hypothetical protein